MAPEFFPFCAFICLALATLTVCALGVALMVSARRRRGPRILATLVLAVAGAMVLALFLLGARIRQQFFLNEPLVGACGRGDLAEARRLLAAGASPDAYGVDFMETALIVASRCGRREVVELLLSKGATVGLRDSWGRTALQRAEEGHHRGIVLLLEKAERSQPK